MPIERVDRPAVGGNGEVIEEAVHHLLQVKPLLCDRPVHQPSYRLLDLPELFPQPLPNGVPQDQVAPACARSADVREAEEGEGFRLAEPLCLAVALRKAPEFDDPGLLRMQFQSELHPQKTRIIEFGRFAERNRKAQGLGKPETFAFLGFTHICGTSTSGGYLILRHTIRQRLREKLRQVKETIGRLMHRPVAEQGLYLKQVMNGFFNYFAVPTNSRAINSFYRHVAWYWCRALRRRGQISRLTWQRMKRLIAYWLPSARIRHPLPDLRFSDMTQGGSPVR